MLPGIKAKTEEYAMGVNIGITVSTQVSSGRWQTVYEEALGLAKKMHLADYQEKEIHGHTVQCLVPTEERRWNENEGFWAFADYRYRDSAEGFFFPKELLLPEDEEPVDVLALRAYQIDAIRTKIPEKNYQHLWDDKTQGHTYHIALLAIGCLVQDRLGDDALVHSDINAGQCRYAVEEANKYLDIPIHVPCQCDVEPWFERVGRVKLEGTDKVRLAVEMFIGREDNAFGKRLRSFFPHDLLIQYWTEEFAMYPMNANGFAWKMKDYLSMGFDVGELCEIVHFTDEEGNDLHEKFIGMLMASRLHWKEKDCSDWMVQDPEDPALEGVVSQLIRAFAPRNRKVDRYIPIDELKRILGEKFGTACDTDALVNAFLRQEKEQEDAGEEGKDPSEIMNETMDKARDEFIKLSQDYDIPAEDYLVFYTPGETIAPNMEKLLRKILTIVDTVTESEDFKSLNSCSEMERGTCLVYASRHFHSELLDTDWEQIFTNLEKDPASFSRYYPLFCIEPGNRVIRHAVIALLVNDDLYAYARTLPPLEEKKDDP